MRITYLSLIAGVSTVLALPVQAGHGSKGMHGSGGHHGSNGLHGFGGHQFHQAYHHRARSLTSANIIKRQREQQRQEQGTNGAGETQTQPETQPNP
jgi:hypothetical protein